MADTVHAGILSKDVEFWLDNAKVENLQEFPDLGGAADQVDVTTLADGARMYINGIKDYGSLEFTFLYDHRNGENSNYRVLRAAEEDGLVHECEVKFPDGASFTFSGMISTTISGAGVNAAIQFRANVNLQSDIEYTPAADDDADDVYILVTRFSDGANPSELGYYEVADGVYTATSDTEVESGKNYFIKA